MYSGRSHFNNQRIFDKVTLLDDDFFRQYETHTYQAATSRKKVVRTCCKRFMTSKHMACTPPLSSLPWKLLARGKYNWRKQLSSEDYFQHHIAPLKRWGFQVVIPVKQTRPTHQLSSRKSTGIPGTWTLNALETVAHASERRVSLLGNSSPRRKGNFLNLDGKPQNGMVKIMENPGKPY